MIKSNIHVGMQEYLGNELAKCNVSKKVGFVPVSVSILTHNLKK